MLSLCLVSHLPHRVSYTTLLLCFYLLCSRESVKRWFLNHFVFPLLHNNDILNEWWITSVSEDISKGSFNLSSLSWKLYLNTILSNEWWMSSEPIFCLSSPILENYLFLTNWLNPLLKGTFQKGVNRMFFLHPLKPFHQIESLTKTVTMFEGELQKHGNIVFLPSHTSPKHYP